MPSLLEETGTVAPACRAFYAAAPFGQSLGDDDSVSFSFHARTTVLGGTRAVVLRKKARRPTISHCGIFLLGTSVIMVLGCTPIRALHENNRANPRSSLARSTRRPALLSRMASRLRKVIATISAVEMIKQAIL
jgi:hypothetical protein